MSADDRVQGLVNRIYDAAADASLWPHFLRNFADTVKGTTTALLFYQGSSIRAAKIDVSIRFDPVHAAAYEQHFCRVNPWLKEWKKRFNCAGPKTIALSDASVPLDLLKHTEFYNDYLLAQDTIHQLGCVVTKTEDTFCAFTCLRTRKAGCFEKSELGLLRALFPHLERGVRFHHKMAELEGQYRSSLDALDRLAAGVVLLDRRGHVRAVNHAAGEIFALNDGLKIDRHELVAATPSQNRRLHAAIVGITDGPGSGGGISVDRPSGKRSFALSILRSPARAFPGEAGEPAVLVFVTDPEKKTTPICETARQIYGLTRAEARLAEQLARGETLVDAGQQLSISHNTARTHLRRIFEKTSTRHQGDLIRLLLATNPSVF